MKEREGENKQDSFIKLVGYAEQHGNPTSVQTQSYPDGDIFAVDIGRAHVNCYLARMNSTIIDNQGQYPLDAVSEEGEKVLSYHEGRVWKLSRELNTITEGGERVLSFVAESLSELARRLGVQWDLVHGIGISVPGVPDRKSGELTSPPLMNTWFRVNIPAFLKSKLPASDKLPIYLNNDANMGAFGESHRDNGQIIEDLVYVKVGTGIGAGLILERKLYCGHGGAAGEFGHILLEQETGRTLPRCASCGKHGCLESLASKHAIIEKVRRNAVRTLTIDNIVDAAKRGDSTCYEALQDAGSRIGRAIGSCLVNVLNPSLVVLDGSVILADKTGDGLLYQALSQSAASSSLIWHDTTIEITHLNGGAIARGTIMTVIENYKTNLSSGAQSPSGSGSRSR